MVMIGVAAEQKVASEALALDSDLFAVCIHECERLPGRGALMNDALEQPELIAQQLLTRAGAAELIELGAGTTELVLKVLQHLARPLALRVLGGAHLVRQVSISATHRAQLARRREHCGGL